VIDPRAVADRHPNSRIRALARLTVEVTERPWALTGASLVSARAAGLEDASVLHAILQTSLFGHLNRIADAVGVELDYADSFGAPHVEPATPPYLWPDTVPDPAAPQPIALESRAGALDLMSAWRAYVLERDAPLTRRQRALVAHAVAVRLGDASVPPVEPETPFDRALTDLADIVTRAPWQLGATAYAPLRAHGLSDDADVFDAVATASSCTVFSRVRVALAALAR
jgi:alkylhydroperoxidase/carboxymuconolactone decarboxylase family protein YurZ